MAIFGNKDKKALPYVDGLYPADGDFASPVVANAQNAYTLQGGVSITNPEVVKVLQGKVEKREPSTPQIDEGIWLMDIAQSHHYTVWIKDMNMSELKVPRSPLTADRGFLPVRNMNLKYTSYENMSIPVAIFGDFPLLSKKRVSTIDLTCYDYDNHKLEYELRQWEAQCFPKGRFVAYMEDIARKFVYCGYSVDGKRTLTYEVYVIPAGNVTVSRDYSANEAKMINFSLVVVGDGRTCAQGEGKIPGTIVEDHGGEGDGRLKKGNFATPYVSGYTTYNERGDVVNHYV